MEKKKNDNELSVLSVLVQYCSVLSVMVGGLHLVLRRWRWQHDCQSLHVRGGRGHGFGNRLPGLVDGHHVYVTMVMRGATGRQQKLGLIKSGTLDLQLVVARRGEQVVRGRRSFCLLLLVA